MSDYPRETEVKLFTPELNIIQQRLESIGAKLIAPRIYERNMRYDNASKSLITSGIVLRLREDSRVRLTYKDPGVIENGIVSRTEIEVEVSDYSLMEAILGKLGYFPSMMYEKYRTTYKIMHTEVVLDEMPYGNFTEIEGDIDAIENVLDELRLSGHKRYTESYSRLFDYAKHHLKLTFNDLTFNNFEGIFATENVFQPPRDS
jgi:adenylate cyclase, class 2